MRHLRPLMRTAGVLAVTTLTGCVTTTETATVTGGTPDVPPETMTVPGTDTITSMFAGKPAPLPVADIGVMWMNRVAYLPDPARNGQMGPGLAGQVMMYDANSNFATANGTLTVDVYDETPRGSGSGSAALLPERWQFKAEDMAKLVAHDERLGKSYTVFLPWLAYRPDVTRVKIMARYDPADGSHPYYAPASTLTLDNTPQSGSSSWSGGKVSMIPGGNHALTGGQPNVAGPGPAGPNRTMSPGMISNVLAPVQPTRVAPPTANSPPAVRSPIIVPAMIGPGR